MRFRSARRDGSQHADHGFEHSTPMHRSVCLANTRNARPSTSPHTMSHAARQGLPAAQVPSRFHQWHVEDLPNLTRMSRRLVPDQGVDNRLSRARRLRYASP